MYYATVDENGNVLMTFYLDDGDQLPDGTVSLDGLPSSQIEDYPNLHWNGTTWEYNG